MIAAAALALAAGACGPAPSEREHVRAVVLPYLSLAPFYIAQEEGFFDAQGLDVEFIMLGRNQEIMTALAQGDVDVAAGMLTVNELNLASQGARVRLVAALAEMLPDHCAHAAVVARRDHMESGAVNDPDRIRDMVIDVDVLVPLGFWLDTLLAGHGLAIDDVELINLPSPAALDALASGAIDATADSEPFLTMHATMGDGVVWQSVGSLLPGYVLSVVMYGPTLLDERPEVGDRFALAMLEAIRQFRLGKTPRNLDIVERATGLTRDQVETACWASVPADGRIDPEVFRPYQQWNVDHGLSSRVLDDDELYDFRFIDFANRELSR